MAVMLLENKAVSISENTAKRGTDHNFSHELTLKVEQMNTHEVKNATVKTLSERKCSKGCEARVRWEL